MHKSLAVVALSAIGLLPGATLLCALTCANDHVAVEAAQSHHCKAPEPTATSISATEHCEHHASEALAPAMVLESTTKGPMAFGTEPLPRESVPAQPRLPAPTSAIMIAVSPPPDPSKPYILRI